MPCVEPLAEPQFPQFRQVPLLFHDHEGSLVWADYKPFVIMNGSLECVNDVIRVVDEVAPVGAFMTVDSSGRIAPESTTLGGWKGLAGGSHG